MSYMEENSRKRARKHQLSTLVLESVKVAGLLSLLVVAPNVIGAMAKLGLIPSKQQGAIIKRATNRLLERGLLEWKDKKLRVTQKGEWVLRRAQLVSKARHVKKRWDGKWRVVVFDIPEKRKGLRQRLKNALKETGYVRLQNSVWVYPYDNEDFITLLKADFRIGDDVRYMIVESIERDDVLRGHFGIS
jgi:CRISPR-associated endonuclease Cas2